MYFWKRWFRPAVPHQSPSQSIGFTSKGQPSPFPDLPLAGTRAGREASRKHDRFHIQCGIGAVRQLLIGGNSSVNNGAPSFTFRSLAAHFQLVSRSLPAHFPLVPRTRAFHRRHHVSIWRFLPTTVGATTDVHSRQHWHLVVLPLVVLPFRLPCRRDVELVQP